MAGEAPLFVIADPTQLHAEYFVYPRDAERVRAGQRVEVLRRGWISGILHLRVGMTELMLRRTGALAILVSPVAP